MLFAGVSAFAQNDDDRRVMADADQAKITMIEADKGIEQFFDSSDAYVIFPNIGKGALIVGAAAGNGVVYENGTAVGMASVKKLDIGLQAGGKSFSEIIFFKDDDAYQDFKDGDFEFTGGLSATLLKSGAAAEADYRDGVAVFALPKAGLMFDVSVGGQKFDYTPLGSTAGE